jgi:hypothetical protein
VVVVWRRQRRGAEGRWPSKNRSESGGVPGRRGQVHDFGLSALTSIGPLQTDRSYSNFCRLALTDENSSIYVSFS